MSSLGTSKGILEIAKFGLYVSVPIFLMYTFANNTKNLQKIMGNDILDFYKAMVTSPNGHLKFSLDIQWKIIRIRAEDRVLHFFVRSYVVYPPEAPRPPSPEELREMARELARKRDMH